MLPNTPLLLLVQTDRKAPILHTALVPLLSIHVHSNQVLLVSRRFLCFILFSVLLPLRSPRMNWFLTAGGCLVDVGLPVSRFVCSCLGLFRAPVSTRGSVSQLSVSYVF